ncbi:hypothetical protein ACFF5U_001573, partial [Campylobacter jejuni]
ASISFNFSITSCICILNPLILTSKNLNIKFQKAIKNFCFERLKYRCEFRVRNQSEKIRL